MITTAKFSVSRNQSQDLLGKVDVLQSWLTHPVYPADMAGELRGASYTEQWEKCNSASWFDAALADGSLIQFRRFDDKLSYSFHDCPYFFQSFEDFAFEQAGEEWPEYAEMLAEEYEFARTSEVFERSATPIRYDFEPKLYTCGRHPAGHIHFGFEGQIRVGVRRILTPLSFCLFVIRQFYPESWKVATGLAEFGVLSNEVRRNLVAVENEMFSGLDFEELYLE